MFLPTHNFFLNMRTSLTVYDKNLQYFDWNVWNIHFVFICEFWLEAGFWTIHFYKMWKYNDEIWIPRFLRKSQSWEAALF